MKKENEIALSLGILSGLTSKLMDQAKEMEKALIRIDERVDKIAELENVYIIKGEEKNDK